MNPHPAVSFRFWLITVAALLAVATTLSLGRWQMSRANQKEVLQQRLAQQGQQSVLVAADVLRSSAAGANGGANGGGNRRVGEFAPSDPLLDRVLTVSGQWLPEYTVLLDNRPMNSKQGFYVLTPLKEAQSGQVIMVQRGWIQRDFNDRERVRSFDTPTGTVQLTGRIARAPSQTFELSATQSQEPQPTDTAGTPRIRQNLSLPEFKTKSQLPLWDYLLLQTDPVADGLLRDWPAPSMGIDKHHGYAFQWFGLSALIAVLYVWFQLVPRLRSSTRPTSQLNPSPSDHVNTLGD